MINRKAQHDISRKLKVLNYAKEHGNIAKACRYFGICRETFYQWKRAYEAHGEGALVNNKPCLIYNLGHDIFFLFGDEHQWVIQRTNLNQALLYSYLCLQVISLLIQHN